MAFKITNYYENDFNKEVKRANDLAAKQKQNVNKTYDAQIKKLNDTAEKQTIATENSYDAAYADNEVNRFINERQIRTSMADAGLQDSGLNRTQLTAVELQKTNADNSISLAKNSAINKIRSSLQESIYEAEQARQQEINDIDTQLMADTNNIYNQMDSERRAKMEEITSNIASITDPTQAAGYIKTVSKQYGIDGKTLAAYSPVVNKNTYQKFLKNEKYFENSTTYKTVHSTLAGIDTSTASGQTVAAKQIKAYAATSGATKSQIKKLCASAGISYSDYNKFLKDGQLFVKREEEKALELARKNAAISSSYSSSGKSNETNYYEEAAKALNNKIERHKEAYSGLSESEYLEKIRYAVADWAHYELYENSMYSPQEVYSAFKQQGYSIDSLIETYDKHNGEGAFEATSTNKKSKKATNKSKK